jgi:hypothetical protein
MIQAICNRSQVQACPGLRLVAYASESATAFEYVWSAIKPMRPSDQWNLYMIQVWARGSKFRVKDNEGIKDPKSSLKMLIFPNNCQFGSKFSTYLLKSHHVCEGFI